MKSGAETQKEKHEFVNRLNVVMVPRSVVRNVNLDTAHPHDCVAISESQQDSVLWYSNKARFRVCAISPSNPFFRPFPNHEWQPVISSGAARPGTEGKTYKITFEFEGGGQLDPEVAIEA